MSVLKTFLILAISGTSMAALAAEMESDPPSAKIFVMKAAQDGMTEVEAGKAALAKSQDPQIRSFASRMVKDHGKANMELATLASGKGIAAPTELDAEHQAMLSTLTDKSGKDFDEAYAKHMKLDHTNAIALFESESMSKDTDFAGFAKKTLPTLKEHKVLAAKLPMN